LSKPERRFEFDGDRLANSAAPADHFAESSRDPKTVRLASLQRFQLGTTMGYHLNRKLELDKRWRKGRGKTMKSWKNVTAVARVARRWLIIAAGVAIVGWMLLFLAGYFHPKVPENSRIGGRPLPTEARLVEVAEWTQPRYETAVGEIQPVHEATIASKILARVAEVNVRAGQSIAADEVLVKLDDAEFQARVKQAESQRAAADARLQKARSDFERAQQLAATNAISKSEFETADSNLKAADAEFARARQAVEESRILLDYAMVRAPFGGTVVDRQVEPGDTVVPGQALMRVFDPTRMQLVAAVRESLALKLKVGQTLPARLDALGYHCQATISEIVPQAESASRTFLVKVTGPCPPGVYSGMFGRIYLPLDEETLTVIPNEAVRQVGQLSLVEVSDGKTVQRRSVRLGRQLDGQWEVLSGVRPGEQLVVLAERPGGHRSSQ
jgi:RND family efflux transporter MFP subunit